MQAICKCLLQCRAEPPSEELQNQATVTDSAGTKHTQIKVGARRRCEWLDFYLALIYCIKTDLRICGSKHGILTHQNNVSCGRL